MTTDEEFVDILAAWCETLTAAQLWLMWRWITRLAAYRTEQELGYR